MPKTRRSIWFEDEIWAALGEEAQRRRMSRPSLVHLYCEHCLNAAKRRRAERQRR